MSDGWDEAAVTINGHTLTQAHVMMIRVAVSGFASDDENLRALGPIGKGYRARAREVEAMLVGGCTKREDRSRNGVRVIATLRNDGRAPYIEKDCACMGNPGRVHSREGCPAMGITEDGDA